MADPVFERVKARRARVLRAPRSREEICDAIYKRAIERINYHTGASKHAVYRWDKGDTLTDEELRIVMIRVASHGFRCFETNSGFTVDMRSSFPDVPPAANPENERGHDPLSALALGMLIISCLQLCCRR
jgi:hypothetical protein